MNLLLLTLEKLFQLIPRNLDPKQSAELCGKIIAFHINPWPTVYVIFTRDGFNFATTCELTPDAEIISGTLQSLRALPKLNNFYEMKSYFILKGDTELIEIFYQNYLKPEFSWQDLTAPVIGDAATETLERFSQRISDNFVKSKQQFTRNLRDYLQEESSLLPTKIEFENLYEETLQLQRHLDRIEARVKILLNDLDDE